MKNIKIKKANSLIFLLLRPIILPVLKFKYKFKFLKKNRKGLKRPCIILSNHVTVADQFFMGAGVYFGINYIATDSIFRHGLRSFLMKLLVRPIPFSKGSNDSTAVKHIISVIKQGGSVGMFPSGNRSFFGEECTINPTLGKLVKKLKVPLVLMNIQGGFHAKPRWKTKKINKGRVTAEIVRLLSAEEIEKLTEMELNAIIIKNLSFNDFTYNEKAKVKFKGKHKAEHLESVLFYCPTCHSLENLKSKGNDFYCTSCQATVRINDYGLFDKISNAQSLPENILLWGKLQLDYVKSLNMNDYLEKAFCLDKAIELYKNNRAKNEEFLNMGEIRLYGDKLTICDKEFLLKDIRSLSLIGVRKLQIYTEDETYSIFCSVGINLFKYMIAAYHFKNQLENIKEEYYGY